MARNDVYLNINALSPADAVVTGQQDMTAATVPELVLGDTPTFNFYFTDNTNVWPSWAGNAAYTVTWALSDAVSGDFSPAATTGNATPITGGWSVVLPLNAYDLVGLLNTKRVSQPYPVTNLWQQIRVADPSGNEVTRAMFWTPVRYRAISDTQNTESASPTGGREVTVDNVNVLTTPTAAQFYAANPVPTSALGSAANGELLIGNGTGFTKSTLTAGTGITVTNGSGSITIDASGAQETLTATVKNAESVAITKGQVVYLFGATGNMPSVKLAYNTSDATSAKTFGVVSDTSIAPNGTGTVTCVGVVDGLNLGVYQDGDTLYLGATPGSVTATKPYAPNHLVYVGIVERANAGNGELYVRIQNGYELDEIHDVQINAPRQSGQTLIYDNTTSLWKNARITAGSNIAVTNGDGSISIGFSGTLPVANGGTGVTTSTGSGSVVLSTSPTLTTPILGTPQSGTLSSCTGLPISTGVSGLGTNVATFLATPSSANLASAVTDETGTGALVFANTPTLVTPNIGAATGTSVNLTGSGTLGTTLTVNGTTDSTNKDTGAIVTEGGLGVEKSATIGGNLTVSGAGTFSGQVNVALSTNTNLAGLHVSNSLSDNLALRLNNTLSGGKDWYLLSGATSAPGTLRIYNATDAVIAAIFSSTGNTTLAGNLTVSGTGTSSFGGPTTIRATSAAAFTPLATSALEINLPYISRIAFGENSAGSANPAITLYRTTAGAAQGTAIRLFQPNATGEFYIQKGTTDAVYGTETYTTNLAISSAGNVLIGTTIDGGQKLQVSGDIISTSTSGSNIIANDPTFNHPVVQLREAGTNKAAFETVSGDAYVSTQTAGKSLYLRSGNSTTALTLDSSQRIIAQGQIWSSNLGNTLLTGFANATTIANNIISVYEGTGSANIERAGRITTFDGGSGFYGLNLQAPTSAYPDFSGTVNWTNALTLTSQSATFAGNIKTAAPSGGTAATWRLGTVATVSPTSPNRTIEVEIGGTTYYIHAKTTNN